MSYVLLEDDSGVMLAEDGVTPIILEEVIEVFAWDPVVLPAVDFWTRTPLSDA